ncbi:MAG TPA: ADP-ribosylation family protein, partial [Kofleriaceae bacterium]|nr:ADP-ribosylation family protein [Kofleriaceae bacterium]
MDRRGQLRELFHVDFPDELFAVWEWFGRLEGETRRAFREVLGIRLHGPFDVLAGAFDGRELRYPAVLHWRYQYDPPELFTVMTGNMDGLHWGYWFDDPGRLPPVVASFYARDAFELVEAPSLFRAIAKHLGDTHRGTLENKAADRKHADAYDRDLAALDALLATLPAIPATPKRVPTMRTPEGMGIVADHVSAWT